MRFSSDTSAGRTDLRRWENRMELKCDKKDGGKGNVWKEPEIQRIIRRLWNFWPDPNDTLCKYVKEFRNFSCSYKWDLEALGFHSVVKSSSIPTLREPLEHFSVCSHRRTQKPYWVFQSRLPCICENSRDRAIGKTSSSERKEAVEDRQRSRVGFDPDIIKKNGSRIDTQFNTRWLSLFTRSFGVLTWRQINHV